MRNAFIGIALAWALLVALNMGGCFDSPTEILPNDGHMPSVVIIDWDVDGAENPTPHVQEPNLLRTCPGAVVEVVEVSENQGIYWFDFVLKGYGDDIDPTLLDFYSLDVHTAFLTTLDVIPPDSTEFEAFDWIAPGDYPKTDLRMVGGTFAWNGVDLMCDDEYVLASVKMEYAGFGTPEVEIEDMCWLAWSDICSFGTIDWSGK